VTLSDGRQLSARLIIAADGARSRARELAELPLHERAYHQSAFVTHIRTEQSHQRTAWQRFLPEGPIALLPLADGRSSIVWTTTPERATELTTMSEPDCAAAIATACDRVLGAVEIAAGRAEFPLRLIHARSYCRRGFVLVGDAAHSVHPLAGQGVNLGFLDAAALAEVLCRAVRQDGPDALGELAALRRYERWRKSENTIAIGLIDGLNSLFSNQNETLGWLRRSGFAVLNQSSVAKRSLIERAMGIAGDLPQMVRKAIS
jgi:2-octaprenylphenol hydroxylase